MKTAVALSDKEKAVIMAYRQATENTREAVHIILQINEEAKRAGFHIVGREEANQHGRREGNT